MSNAFYQLETSSLTDTRKSLMEIRGGPKEMRLWENTDCRKCALHIIVLFFFPCVFFFMEIGLT